jgi:hypothetical protein
MVGFTAADSMRICVITQLKCQKKAIEIITKGKKK